jgi:dihydropyrimidinase
VEDRVTLIFQRVRSGQLSPSRWVELVATNPAKMFGLYPRKGTIAPGFDADIVIFDPNRERVISAESHHMNVDYSCYEGMTVWGLPEVVMQRGNVLVENDEWFGTEGGGTFVPRSRFQEP